MWGGGADTPTLPEAWGCQGWIHGGEQPAPTLGPCPDSVSWGAAGGECLPSAGRAYPLSSRSSCSATCRTCLGKGTLVPRPGEPHLVLTRLGLPRRSCRCGRGRARGRSAASSTGAGTAGSAETGSARPGAQSGPSAWLLFPSSGLWLLLAVFPAPVPLSSYRVGWGKNWR